MKINHRRAAAHAFLWCWACLMCSLFAWIVVASYQAGLPA